VRTWGRAGIVEANEFGRLESSPARPLKRILPRAIYMGLGFKMDAFAQPQDRSATIGPRFDYLALAPQRRPFATLFYSGPFMPSSARRPQRLRLSQLSARP